MLKIISNILFFNDYSEIAIASHYLKKDFVSHTRFEGTPVKDICNVQFVTIKKEEGDVSFRVERLEDNKFTITDLATGKSTT